ncbi:SDR family oxidoreductase [Rhodospirillaceae bacterium SYSU D60014]|uniref:SDR family NAD(P)-dependent oxidoreductase n=1 Tax=Virgifigura deserti TaxID=2268457 RepID=UPI0013C4DE41
MDEKPLQGRTAIVTGSGQNIGKAIALRFAAAGANVVINGHRDQAKIEAVADEARGLGVEALARLADVGDPEAVSRLVCDAVARFGAVDIAVSNVALRPFQPFLEISVADWNRILNINLNAAFYLARAVLPQMQERRWGRILHIAGSDAVFAIPNRAHVLASKAAVHALAKAIALEFGPYGITANTVAPGWIETARDMKNYPDYEATVRQLRETIPLRRLGRVEEVANACLYLASDLGSFVTGQMLHVNGGEVMV